VESRNKNLNVQPSSMSVASVEEITSLTMTPTSSSAPFVQAASSTRKESASSSSMRVAEHCKHAIPIDNSPLKVKENVIYISIS
jgi:hypothetical protein